MNVINMIDQERSDISRSRYILRLIENGRKEHSRVIPVDNDSFEARHQQVSEARSE
jgi:hypothetical protein